MNGGGRGLLFSNDAFLHLILVIIKAIKKSVHACSLCRFTLAAQNCMVLCPSSAGSLFFIKLCAFY